MLAVVVVVAAAEVGGVREKNTRAAEGSLRARDGFDRPAASSVRSEDRKSVV